MEFNQMFKIKWICNQESKNSFSRSLEKMFADKALVRQSFQKEFIAWNGCLLWEISSLELFSISNSKQKGESLKDVLSLETSK